MNKNNVSNNTSNRKRKAKKRRKDRKWKRSKLHANKIFQETSFDDGSSDETESLITEKLPSQKSDPIEYKFARVLNLTPSKSESESPQIVISDSESNDNVSDDASGTVMANCIEASSDEDSHPFGNGSVLDEFMDDSIVSSDTEIMSAQVYKIEPAKKKKLPPREEPPKKKIKPEKIVTNEPQLYYTSDGIIAILEKNSTVYLHGLCSLTVLHGQIEILGHTLTKNSPQAKIYSPRGSALLYLQNTTESDIPATNYLSNLNTSKRVQLTERCAVVLCKKLEDPHILFIEKHISQQILPVDNNFPRIIFEPKEGQWNLLKPNHHWNNIIDGIDNGTRLMICGGKGVGKTTFLRFAINTLLMRFTEVRVIDLDPGQSEFTVPGCISVVTVTKPMFGPNYTHLQNTEKSILSNINIGYDPEKYIFGVKELLASEFNQVPTLINYMGYTHGIGLNILSAVITFVRPSNILQINSREAKKNYKFLLSSEVVTDNAKLFVTDPRELSYSLVQIESMSDGSDGWVAEPRQLREMCVLSYINRMIESDSIFNTQKSLYRINLDEIFITDSSGDTIHPAAINACVVALCKMKGPEKNIFECLSWGIIRGINLETKELVLLTSQTLEVLDEVTHLVSSGATLPPSVYMTPDGVMGPMPYVIEGALMSFGQIPKRSHVSAIKSA